MYIESCYFYKLEDWPLIDIKSYSIQSANIKNMKLTNVTQERYVFIAFYIFDYIDLNLEDLVIANNSSLNFYLFIIWPYYNINNLYLSNINIQDSFIKKTFMGITNIQKLDIKNFYVKNSIIKEPFLTIYELKN